MPKNTAKRRTWQVRVVMLVQTDRDARLLRKVRHTTDRVATVHRAACVGGGYFHTVSWTTTSKASFTKLAREISEALLQAQRAPTWTLELHH